MNISFDGSDVTMESDSQLLILADVAALEGLATIARDNPTLGDLTRAQVSTLLSAAQSGFNVYVHDLGAVPSGPFPFSYTDLERADEDESDTATVDSGALVILDASKLAVICEVLTWEAYDHALQDAGSSRFDALTARAGGAFFAILHGDADASHCFHGDGAYRIREGKKA